MTTIDEKEILEIEKLKQELRQSPWLYVLKFYAAALATIAITATITKYFLGV